MKKLVVIGIFWAFAYQLFAQAQYDGALERYKMKSDQSVRDGLVGEYYSGINFNKLVKVRQDKEIYFDWDYSNPVSELGSDYFSVRWRGKVYAEKAGKYVFTAYTDDGMRIWLNGRLIINAWKDQPPTLYEARVVLEGDQFYDIRVDYYQKEFQTTAGVFFNPEGEKRQALNASNTVFGRNLEASNAKFDFYEKPSLMDDFWSWMGMDEKEEAQPFMDRSYKPDNETPQKVVAIREEQKTDDDFEAVKRTDDRSSVKVSNDVISITPKTETKLDSSDNKYEKMLPGETLIVDNIYFDQGKAKLREESYRELEKLIAALNNHPEWRIKIDGHTDNVGYAALNLELSFDRARSVYFYLIKNGIDKSRLKYEGFGSSRPLADNNSEENKQMNRRVEVSLLENASISSSEEKL